MLNIAAYTCMSAFRSLRPDDRVPSPHGDCTARLTGNKHRRRRAVLINTGQNVACTVDGSFVTTKSDTGWGHFSVLSLKLEL